MKHKIEIFSAGCATCKETIEAVKKLAGSEHDVHVHDMHQHETASRAKQHGIRSLPAVVIDGGMSGSQSGAPRISGMGTRLCAQPQDPRYEGRKA
jgi:glutaredoxin